MLHYRWGKFNSAAVRCYDGAADLICLPEKENPRVSVPSNIKRKNKQESKCRCRAAYSCSDFVQGISMCVSFNTCNNDSLMTNSYVTSHLNGCDFIERMFFY
jgi:hypothetical protein